MGFYSLTKEKRMDLVAKITKEIQKDIQQKKDNLLSIYFSDEDTYIRKTAYLAIGKIYKAEPKLQPNIIGALQKLAAAVDFKIRQTSINAAGEIGIHNFKIVELFFDKGLFDEHHAVRNAVIGSIKKMGVKNPVPVLQWAKKYLHHEDKEIRREICHGIELRGRTHPEDILDMLQELEKDKTARVCNTLVHVIGQISYKKNCLAKVITHLNSWSNKDVVAKCAEEIIDVHDRYKNFAILTQAEAADYIDKHLKIK